MDGKTVKVKLEKHLWLNKGQPNEQWFNAGERFVTEADASLLRGQPGVTFPDEHDVPAPPAPIEPPPEPTPVVEPVAEPAREPETEVPQPETEAPQGPVN